MAEANDIPLQSLPEAPHGQSSNARHNESRPVSPIGHSSDNQGADGGLVLHSTPSVHSSTKTAVAPNNASTPSTTLRSSDYIIWLVIAYAAVALTAWIAIWKLTYRPFKLADFEYLSYHPSKRDLARDARLYRAARVVQSVIAVLTIPLTSAVCSSAAVIYTQRNARRYAQRNQNWVSLSLRQTMTLADRGWTDLTTYFRLITKRSGFRKYGSKFLSLAIVLTLLGCIIAPLQEAFLSQANIQTPSAINVRRAGPLVDLADLRTYKEVTYDSNAVVLSTRSALASATLGDSQPYMWLDACKDNELLWSDLALASCSGGATFDNMSLYTDPFFAELTPGYNTGLDRQYLPRINSTARYENVSSMDYPDCSLSNFTYSAQYGNMVGQGSNYPLTWALEICMPANLSISPWLGAFTGNRLDFTEEFYLNVTVLNSGGWNILNTSDSGTVYKVTLDTTVGYFELPNYMNNGVAGPLLAEHKNKANMGCDFLSQSYNDPCYDNGSLTGLSRVRPRDYDSDGRLPVVVEGIMNKGPLFTIALALFGEGSFIDLHSNHPEVFAGQATNSTDAPGFQPCEELTPLSGLLWDSFRYGGGQRCTTRHVDYNGSTDYSDTDGDIVQWLGSFIIGNPPVERITNAFNAAAFLTNKAWISGTNGLLYPEKTLYITSDLGDDTQVPALSLPVLIVISVLLGIQLFSLLTLAIYACRTPRWTDRLDSWTMMRIGATLGDKIPLSVARKTDTIDILDETPGWIGDETPDESVGVIGLGGADPLRQDMHAFVARRRYACYPGEALAPPTPSAIAQVNLDDMRRRGQLGAQVPRAARDATAETSGVRR